MIINHMTRAEQASVDKMASKPYRFVWFARTSWGFMQGQRFTMLRDFFGAWRSFNRQCEADAKARAERQAYHDKYGCQSCKMMVQNPPDQPVWLGKVQ